MDDECFRFVCQFRPVQVLATLPLAQLLTSRATEIRALARYVDFPFEPCGDDGEMSKDFVARLHFFCDRVVDQKFIVQRPDHDYRLFLVNVLRYKESPQYLLNMTPAEIQKCTPRQLRILLRHVHRFVRRNADWPTEFKQLFFNTIACGELFPAKNLVQQMEKIFRAPEYCLNALPAFEKSLLLESRASSCASAGGCADVDEIVSMFERYDWISSDRDEAKIIATGFGLDPKIHWPSSGDYYAFCRSAQNKQFVFSRAAAEQQVAARDGSCIFCCLADADSVRIPCGHVAGCFGCESRYASPRCSVCRQQGSFFKIFKSSI